MDNSRNITSSSNSMAALECVRIMNSEKHCTVYVAEHAMTFVPPSGSSAVTFSATFTQGLSEFHGPSTPQPQMTQENSHLYASPAVSAKKPARKTSTSHYSLLASRNATQKDTDSHR